VVLPAVRITSPSVHLSVPVAAVAVFVEAPKMPVVPAGPAGLVTFQTIAFVPAGHDLPSWTLSAPVFCSRSRESSLTSPSA
jgi:hypothetical protein